MTIDIVGAGIGGLTTAIALEQKGIKTRIFEQKKEIKPVGAGIILANNAMQVYEKLGLRKAIEASGNPISSMNITKANLSPISKVDLSFFERKHKVKNIAIHRGILQQLLIDKLKSSKLKLNHKLESLSQDEEGFSLTFTNQKSYQSSILIGADGINSTIRENLFPNNKIRHANQICWRGVTTFDLPSKYINELNEAWGKTGRVGFVQIAKGKVYWYALKSFKNHQNEFSIDNIQDYFSDYSTIIQEIIASTNKEHINTAEISDLKPTNTWVQNNVCLIGDAAHATTPNLGQGACQAIEDAYVLSECLDKYDTIKAFEKYQALRLPKAKQVTKTSWLLGKIAHQSNPLLINIRNQMMRMTPDFVNKMQSERIFQLASI